MVSGRVTFALPRLALFLLPLPLLTGAAAAPPSAPNDQQPVVLSLTASVSTAAPGEPFTVGAHLKLAPGWHVYWSYPGNTGKPTVVDVSVAGDAGGAERPRFPAPHAFPGRTPEEFSLGYENAVLATSQVEPADLAPGQSLTVLVKAAWLACKESCVDGSAEQTLSVKVGETAVPSPDAPVLAAAVKQLPAALGPSDARLLSVGLQEGRLAVRMAVPGLASGGAFLPRWMYPSNCQVASHSLTRDAAGTWVAELVMAGKDCLPGVGGVVCDGTAGGKCLELPPLSTGNSLPPLVAVTPAAVVAPAAAAAVVPAVDFSAPVPTESLWWFILLAVLGGLILNVMPCVIPVAVPKLLHVVRTASQAQDPAHQKAVLLKHALAYSGGVLATMMALALVVTQLRALGTRVGWGFHFQNFWFLVVMVSVLTVLGMGMLKVFPMQSSHHDDALRSLKSYRTREPVMESFMTGLLVTFLGTPCTAPMLGPALGYAFTQPPAMTFTIFGAVGVGLASPFLLLATWTGWARWLPTRVSERYDRVMRGMGFLLFGTGVWLLGVVASAHGSEAAINLLWLQVVLGLGGWVLGLWADKTKDTWPTLLAKATPLLAGAVLAGAYLLSDRALPAAKPVTTADAAGSGPGALHTAAGGVIGWGTFSTARVEELRAAGKTVFVDFTADWCMNCKYNEKMVLETAATKAMFEARGIVPLKGDYTLDDPVIHQWLTSFGRAGVPLNLLMPACSKGRETAVVLPEIYTAEVLAAAVEKAGPARACN